MIYSEVGLLGHLKAISREHPFEIIRGRKLKRPGQIVCITFKMSLARGRALLPGNIKGGDLKFLTTLLHKLP